MNDRELEELMRDYEAEVAAYKRLPQAEPTALLDRAVLTKARAAVGHVHKPPRWIALAASFAGVAIAAGIGWRVYEAQQARHDGLLQDKAARGEAFEVEVLPSSSRDRAKALEMAQMPPPPPPPPAAPEPPKEAEAFAESKLRKQEQPGAPAAASAAVASEEALAAPAVVAPMPQRAAEPEPHTRADHAVRGGVPEQRQNRSAPASATSGAGLGLADADDHLDQRERNEGDAELGGRLAKGKDDASLRPEVWLEQIRTLVRERKYARARLELVRFRQVHPNVVIPTDLRRYVP